MLELQWFIPNLIGLGSVVERGDVLLAVDV